MIKPPLLITCLLWYFMIYSTLGRLELYTVLLHCVQMFTSSIILLYLYRASIQRFYYDNETRQCQSFTYGGCQGNTNNFETVEACEEACPGGYIYTYSYCVILLSIMGQFD